MSSIFDQISSMYTVAYIATTDTKKTIAEVGAYDNSFSCDTQEVDGVSVVKLLVPVTYDYDSIASRAERVLRDYISSPLFVATSIGDDEKAEAWVSKLAKILAKISKKSLN